MSLSASLTARDAAKIAARNLLGRRRLKRARDSVLGAAEWRNDRWQTVVWQVDLAEACDELVDSMLAGTGLRMTLSAPPRHGKSELVGRSLPVRAILAADKPIGIMYVTSSDARAEEVSRRVRSAVERIYRETGDDQYAPSSKWSAKEWETKGGHSWVGCGWQSTTGGIGCHILIMDDLIGSSETYRSKAKRSRIRHVVQEDLLTRIMDGGTAIHMETRRGVDDTTAWLQREFGEVWTDRVWRCWEPDRGYLWPEVYGEEWRSRNPHLTDASPIWRALFQQEPVPSGGTLISMDWLMATYSEPVEVVARLAERIEIGADLPRKKTETSDKVGIVVMAKRGAYRDILEVVNKRCNYPEQRQIMRDLSTKWGAHGALIELAANGDALVDDLKAEVAGIRGASATADKVARLTPHLPRFAAGQVRTPASNPPWAASWRQEMANFSGIDGELDDQVDGTVWALVACEDGNEPSAEEALDALAAVFG